MGEKSIKQPLSKLIHVYVAGNSNQITKIDVLKLVNTRRSKQFVVISPLVGDFKFEITDEVSDIIDIAETWLRYQLIFSHFKFSLENIYGDLNLIWRTNFVVHQNSYANFFTLIYDDYKNGL